jgi:hypothetical protein
MVQPKVDGLGNLPALLGMLMSHFDDRFFAADLVGGRRHSAITVWRRRFRLS